MNLLKKILIPFFILSLVGCNGQENTGSVANEDVATSVEDAVNTLGVAMDDQANEAYATNIKKSYPEMIEEFIFPKAYASNCTRPVNMACNSGVKLSEFQDCSIFHGNAIASGWISLNYSELDCSLDVDGKKVARTYDYEIVGPRGGQHNITSSDQVDYRGNTIGGGAELTKVAGGWELDILGKNRTFIINGRTRRNKSIRTLQPLEIQGGIRRSQRRVNNGQLEVIHNLAEFTATYTAVDLQYSSSCCHPVSGSLSVDFAGSIEGSGTVTFNSCGSAQIERNGEVQDVTFTYCE